DGLPCAGHTVLDGDLGLVVLPLGLGRWEECRIVWGDEDAAQGGGVPAGALAGSDSAGIQLAGDLTERCLGQELAEDALDDGGFGLVDAESSALLAAVSGADPPVPEGSSSGGRVPLGAAPLSVAGGTDGLEPDLTLGQHDQELEGGVVLVSVDAASDGQYAHIALGWAEFEDIREAAGEAVDVVGEHRLELACVEVAEHAGPLSLLPAGFGPADIIVGVGVDDRPPTALRLDTTVFELLEDALRLLDGLPGVD